MSILVTQNRSADYCLINAWNTYLPRTIAEVTDDLFLHLREEWFVPNLHGSSHTGKNNQISNGNDVDVSDRY